MQVMAQVTVELSEEQEDELVKEDEVTVVEKTLEIRDDSNSVIDITARSLLGIIEVKYLQIL